MLNLLKNLEVLNFCPIFASSKLIKQYVLSNFDKAVLPLS